MAAIPCGSVSMAGDSPKDQDGIEQRSEFRISRILAKEFDYPPLGLVRL